MTLNTTTLYSAVSAPFRYHVPELQWGGVLRKLHQDWPRSVPFDEGRTLAIKGLTTRMKCI
eukprot:2844124-Amphidinium_carterae.1